MSYNEEAVLSFPIVFKTDAQNIEEIEKQHAVINKRDDEDVPGEDIVVNDKKNIWHSEQTSKERQQRADYENQKEEQEQLQIDNAFRQFIDHQDEQSGKSKNKEWAGKESDNNNPFDIINTSEAAKGNANAGKLLEFIETTDKEGLRTLSKFAANPGGLVQNELIGVLGRAGIAGAVAVSLIAIIVESPAIIQGIIRSLAVKGAPLNQDYHRHLDQENSAAFNRLEQYRRAAGLDVIITNNQRGYLLQDPFSVTNSLIDIDKTRVLRVSTFDTRHGYVSAVGT